jgi:hypothetical protein
LFSIGDWEKEMEASCREINELLAQLFAQESKLETEISQMETMQNIIETRDLPEEGKRSLVKNCKESISALKEKLEEINTEIRRNFLAHQEGQL